MKPRVLLFAITLALPFVTAPAQAAEILNASYDVSRELFDDVNPAFAAQWKASTGETLQVRQSHTGSSKQARSVAEGLLADVVTLNQITDIELLQKSGLVGKDWRQRLPRHASPYYSLPMFMVRRTCRCSTPAGVAPPLPSWSARSASR